MDCATLRSEKWKACHPTGEPKVGHERCSEGMSKEKLTELYNAHSECLSYREQENNSSCFSKKDKGYKAHKKAQLVEEQETMICLHLLNDYEKNRNGKESEEGVEGEGDDESEESDDEENVYDAIDEIDPPVKVSQVHSSHVNESSQSSMLSTIFTFVKWILMIIAIVALLYFILYIT